ncbi:hypothetical protein KBD45_05065 [Candidatus Dojkabacteria bacterium]|nr:hypothetical protein [Candidatus Dojkabacteria bacterium]
MKSKFTKQFCTVTPFTKMLALTLFIVLPIVTFIIGLYIGIKFGRDELLIIENKEDPTEYEKTILLP